MPQFTLKAVLEEIQRWSAQGTRCFERLRQRLQLPRSEKPVLDRLYPQPTPLPTG